MVLESFFTIGGVGGELEGHRSFETYQILKGKFRKV